MNNEPHFTPPTLAGRGAQVRERASAFRGLDSVVGCRNFSAPMAVPLK
jgi:hypothetical protein